MKQLALALSLFAAPAAAQSVWIVDAAGGAGSTHTSIQAAIDAASDGDTVLIRHGAYAAFTLSGKGLVVVAEPGWVTQVFGSVRVEGVPAASEVVLRGFEQVGPEAATSGLTAVDCAGALWVEKCSFAGQASPAVWLDGCAVVTIARTECVGGHGANGVNFGAPGSPGLLARAANVTAFDSSFRGGHGGYGQFGGGRGGHGVHLTAASHAVVVGGTYFGGTGGGSGMDFDPISGRWICGTPGTGGSGVFATNTAGSATTIAHVGDFVGEPGAGGEGECGGAFAGSAVEVTVGAVVHDIPGEARGLRVQSPVREGHPFNMTFTGVDGDFALALVSTAQAFVALPELFGALVVDPALVVVPMGIVPANGVLQLGTVAPDLDPAAFAATLYVQSAFATPALELRLGAASQLTIVDSSL